jgi:hypothetical protein
MIPSSKQLGKWLFCYTWICLFITQVVVLRCVTILVMCPATSLHIQTLGETCPFYINLWCWSEVKGSFGEVLNLFKCSLLPIWWILESLCAWGACQTWHVPSTSFPAALLSVTSQWSGYWGFIHPFPMMSLSKASLCQAEGLNKIKTCCLQSLAVVSLHSCYLCL